MVIILRREVGAPMTEQMSIKKIVTYLFHVRRTGNTTAQSLGPNGCVGIVSLINTLIYESRTFNPCFREHPTILHFFVCVGVERYNDSVCFILVFADLTAVDLEGMGINEAKIINTRGCTGIRRRRFITSGKGNRGWR